MTQQSALSHDRQTIEGQITAIQEERFRMVSPDGRGFTFILSHKANVLAPDLHWFHQTQTPVRVEYSGEPSLDSGVAHHVLAQNR